MSTPFACMLCCRAMKSYIFDIGGVLLDFDMGFISKSVAGGSAEKLEQVRRIRTEKLHMGVETGAMSDEEFVRQVINPIAPHWTRQDLVNVWIDTFTVNNEGIQLLRDLREMGMPTYILSNLAGHNLEAINRKFPWLPGMADRAFYSFKLGLMKPDPRVYRRVCEETGAEPSECVFLDDTQECVDGACLAGMEGILFSSDRIDEIRDRILP